jgi:hypothetical protein
MNEQESSPLSSTPQTDRRPCPVCGHPTSDCKSDTEHMNLESRPVFVETAALSESKTIYVPFDVVEEREIAPHTRVTFVLAQKGTYVSPRKAKELGII